VKVGDLVMRQPEFGEWVKYNPWMYTEKDLEIGMVVGETSAWGTAVHVLWPKEGLSWEQIKNLIKVDENKNRR